LIEHFFMSQMKQVAVFHLSCISRNPLMNMRLTPP
ncbi:hypothetical protein T11_8376, partial [Trichinella zimbabwensis]